jgi:hypothetical protein
VAGVICGGLTLLAVLAVAGDRWRLLAPVAIFLAVGFRRRQPMAALAVVIAAALVGGLTSPVRILALLSPAAYVLYLVTVTRPLRTSLSALVRYSASSRRWWRSTNGRSPRVPSRPRSGPRSHS